MILQGLSAETLARLVRLARFGDDYSGLLSGPSEELSLEEPGLEEGPPPVRLLAAE